MIQVAGQLEGIAAGDIQGQLEDELAPAVLAKVDTRLAVGAEGHRLASRAERVQGIEAGHIQLQGGNPVAPGGDRHLADGDLLRPGRAGADVLATATIEIRLLDGNAPDGGDHRIGRIGDHCRGISGDH
ncbi:hypothetical protein D3C73_1314210 [compost metagenome]